MKRLKRAFTVIETVIILALIAILAAILIPVFNIAVRKAEESVTYSNCNGAVLYAKVLDVENDGENVVYSGIVVSEGCKDDDIYYLYSDGALYKLSDVARITTEFEVEKETEYIITVGDYSDTVTTPQELSDDAVFRTGTVEIGGTIYTSVFFCNMIDTSYYSTAYIYGGVFFASADDLEISVYEEPVKKPAHDGDHIFSLEWMYDEETHWHPCIIEGCEEKLEEVTLPHEFNEDGICIWCGYDGNK